MQMIKMNTLHTGIASRVGHLIKMTVVLFIVIRFNDSFHIILRSRTNSIDQKISQVSLKSSGDIS